MTESDVDKLRQLLDAARWAARSYDRRGRPKTPCTWSHPLCMGRAMDTGCTCKAPGRDDRDRMLGECADLLERVLADAEVTP